MSTKISKEVKDKIKGCSISNGIVRGSDIFHLILYKDKIIDSTDHTVDLQILNDQYGIHVFDWITISQCIISHLSANEQQCLMLSIGTKDVL